MRGFDDRFVGMLAYTNVVVHFDLQQSSSFPDHAVASQFLTQRN